MPSPSSANLPQAVSCGGTWGSASFPLLQKARSNYRRVEQGKDHSIGRGRNACGRGASSLWLS